ncbi:hypothetical protein LY625_01710 [Lysobacter sp. GX 14042]|uniref:hypothetical protein n=1 Tax=Lysobacter sp. GX 14042 TaxID=2907155 RepID=UPI001F2DE4FE|nr:hypothetical protein [Lysobacter sp. GX 14042]MCE7031353.1 hypothetical protein [Lysobacter sp. GX 14042]
MALDDLDRDCIATLAASCELWMGWEREALARGDLLEAARCADRAESASDTVFFLVGAKS